MIKESGRARIGDITYEAPLLEMVERTIINIMLMLTYKHWG